MKACRLLLGFAAGVLLASFAQGQAVGYRQHPDHPWGPVYFRALAPDDAEYVPIFAIRSTACIPEDFVLNNIIDMTPGNPPFAMRAYACPLVISGHSVYAEESDVDRMRAPLLTVMEGKNSVVVYLIPNASFYASPGKPVTLTFKRLLDMKEKLVGVATDYSEVFSPNGGPLGGGGKQPWDEIRATGKLTDGRTFRYYAKLETPPGRPDYGIITNFELVIE